jgi:hypothetical protein
MNNIGIPLPPLQFEIFAELSWRAIPSIAITFDHELMKYPLDPAASSFNFDRELSAVFLGAFVDTLKPTPAAHVVNEDFTEICISRLDVIHQFDQTGQVLYSKPALTFIKIGANDRNVLLLRKSSDRRSLVLYRISLIVGRHPHILRGSERTFALR